MSRYSNSNKTLLEAKYKRVERFLSVVPYLDNLNNSLVLKISDRFGINSDAMLAMIKEVQSKHQFNS